MEVRIYREPENESLILNEDELIEYNELVNSLGIVESKPSNESKPSVYVCLNTQMKNALTALCPAKVDLEKYSRSTIPVEILKVVKFCKDNKVFDKYQVWYDDSSPDPLLIGKKYRSENDRLNDYEWNSESYLIARWGDCSMEIEVLLEKGFERIKNSLLDFAIKSKVEIDSIIQNPDVYARDVMKTGSFSRTFNLSSGTIF